MRTKELTQLISEHKHIKIRVGYATTYFLKRDGSVMGSKGQCAFVDDYNAWNTKYMTTKKAIASLVTRIRYAENRYDNRTVFCGPSPLNLFVTIFNEHGFEEKNFTINLRGE